jgi:hypothetical protein
VTENELTNLALKIERYSLSLSEREDIVLRALLFAVSDPEVRIGMRDPAEFFDSKEMEVLQRMDSPGEGK